MLQMLFVCDGWLSPCSVSNGVALLFASLCLKEWLTDRMEEALV